MYSNEAQESNAVSKIASEFDSTVNKLKLAMVGIPMIGFSYLFLWKQGFGSNFIAMAWPGMVLCTPFGYDVVVKFLNKRQ